MLEIIAIVALARRNGKICKEKNINPGWYQFLTVVLWIIFEFAGAFIAAFIGSEGIGLYAMALAGAGLGALLSYLVVNSLKPKIVNENTIDGKLIQ